MPRTEKRSSWQITHPVILLERERRFRRWCGMGKQEGAGGTGGGLALNVMAFECMGDNAYKKITKPNQPNQPNQIEQIKENAKKTQNTQNSPRKPRERCTLPQGQRTCRQTSCRTHTTAAHPSTLLRIPGSPVTVQYGIGQYGIA